MTTWWPYLDEPTRGEVDADVPADRPVQAIRVVWEALRPLGVGVGLYDAQRVVHERYEVLGDRVRRAPPDPLDVASLAARAAAQPGRVVAVEAVWDGDTVHDWFVVLVAVLEEPAGEVCLATVYWRRGEPGPAVVAGEAGRAPARHLGVPFHFASPDDPDDEAPRWREVRCPGQ
ncbi:hypothetical protein [Streptomyces sp. NPDC086787]|uniref:hypothetical protein n=1 Tax=Streptomyces sp. NPDC086787 TaxID=3365759 RepID=UPI003806147A